MSKFKYIIIVITMFLLTTNIVHAEQCDTQDIERLKGLANKIEVSYKYIGDSAGEDKNTFKITFTNINDELSITHNEGGDFKTKGKSKLSFKTPYTSDEYLVYSSVCDAELRYLKMDLSDYNEYAFINECDGITGEKLKLCDVNYKNKLSYEKAKQIIEDYRNEHPVGILEKIIKYSPVILISIAVIVVTIIIIKKINFKIKSKLD